MAVSIDRVYQKVLALANKEQRGYITPQEFNLFADHAQMEIFEQYFYDLDQFSRVPGNNQSHVDKIKSLKDKIDKFQKYSPNHCEVVNDEGWLQMYNHHRYSEPGIWGNDLYRLVSVRVTYLSKGFSDSVEAQYVTTNELDNYQKKEIVNTIVDYLGEGKLEYVKFDDPRNYKVNFDKIQKELSYQYQFSLEDGIRELYEKIQLGEY